MVDIVHLKQDEMPPPGERFLLQEWKDGEGIKTETTEEGVVQQTPSYLWTFMLAENRKNAEQMGLAKLYVRDQPDAR